MNSVSVSGAYVGTKGERAALRARLAELRAQLRLAVRARAARMRELTDIFRTERRALRAELRDARRLALKKLHDDIRLARQEATLRYRAQLAEVRKQADSDIEVAKAALALDREHRKEQVRIDADAKTRREAIDKEHEAKLSSGVLAAAHLGAYGPLFERIASKTTPVPGESRTEALLRYAESHPDEAHAVLEPRAERAIEQTKTAIANVGRTLRDAPSDTPRPRLSVIAGGGGADARRKGQVPRSGGGMLLTDLVRERDELAKSKAKPHGKDGPTKAAVSKLPGFHAALDAYVAMTEQELRARHARAYPNSKPPILIAEPRARWVRILEGRAGGLSRSAHAFVDTKTGDIFDARSRHGPNLKRRLGNVFEHESGNSGTAPVEGES